MKFIPPRNDIANAKWRVRPQAVLRRAETVMRGQAERYRAGSLRPEELTPEDREQLCLYLVTHPQRRRWTH